MPVTIQIKNPRIRELVAAEQVSGAGRNATETAENLIRDGVEWRRIQRAMEGQPPVGASALSTVGH